jgi:hypothetical protein
MRSKPSRKGDRGVNFTCGVFTFLFFRFVVRTNPERSRVTVRKEGQVELEQRRPTDLARVQSCPPPTGDVNTILQEIVKCVSGADSD